MQWISEVEIAKSIGELMTSRSIAEKTDFLEYDMPNAMIASICGRENRIGTSPVSSTSTLVERGGVVGKLMMQLSRQVSVSELANTEELLQGQNSFVMP